MKPSIFRSLAVVAVALMAGVLFLATPGQVQAGACVTTGVSTSWNDSAAWSGCDGLLPASTDTVSITSDITLDTDASVRSVSVTGGIFSAGDGADRTLTIQGDLTVTDPGALDPGVSNNYIIVSGDVRINTDAVFTAPVGITLGGDWINDSVNFLAGTGTAVKFTGAAAQISGNEATPFTVLRQDTALASDTLTINSSISVSDRIDIVKGTIILDADNVSSCGGLSMSQTATFEVGGTAPTLPCSGALLDGGSLVNFKGDVDQDVPGVTYGNLWITTASTKSTTGIVGVKNNLSITHGTLNVVISVGHFGGTPGTLSVASGAVLEFSGTGTFIPVGGGYTLFDTSTSVLAPGSTVNYSRGNSQTISAVQENWTTAVGYANLQVTGAGTKTQAANIHVREDLTIGTGSTLAVSGTGRTLYVGETWTNNGTFTPRTASNSNTVQLYGSAPQTVTGTAVGGTTFHNLTINNTGGTTGVSLVSHNATVNNALAFTNGRITLGASDLIMAGTALAVTGTQDPLADNGGPGFPGYLAPDASMMVVADSTGRMCRVFAADYTSYTFPVGDATGGTYRYSPAVMAYSTGSPDTICMNLRYMKHLAFPATVSNFLNRFWSVTRSGTGAFLYSAVFHYNEADISGSEDLVGAVRYGVDPIDSVAKWYRYESAHNATDNTIFYIDLTRLSDFTASDKTYTSAGFEYFRAAKVSGGVQLSWMTAFEHNVSGFNLYRREAGQDDFVKLNGAAVPALGPGGGAYSYLDASAQAGKVYEYKVEESDTDLNATGAAYTTYYPHVIFLSLVR